MKPNTTTVRRGQFARGERYVRASTVWRDWMKNKYRGVAASGRGAPVKHKRVGDCPACSKAASHALSVTWSNRCTRPGVPATRSFSYRMTRQVRMLLRNLGVGDAKISIRRVAHRGEPLVIRVAR